jgi:hypothetical protein
MHYTTDVGQLIFSEQKIRAAIPLASGSGTLDFSKLTALLAEARTDRSALHDAPGAINIKQSYFGNSSPCLSPNLPASLASEASRRWSEVGRAFDGLLGKSSNEVTHKKRLILWETTL